MISEAASTAIAFSGRLAASFDRRWWYSRAAIPGVTVHQHFSISSQIQETDLPQASKDEGAFHAQAARIEAPPLIQKHNFFGGYTVY